MYIRLSIIHLSTQVQIIHLSIIYLSTHLHIYKYIHTYTFSLPVGETVDRVRVIRYMDSYIYGYSSISLYKYIDIDICLDKSTDTHLVGHVCDHPVRETVNPVCVTRYMDSYIYSYLSPSLYIDV